MGWGRLHATWCERVCVADGSERETQRKREKVRAVERSSLLGVCALRGSVGARAAQSAIKKWAIARRADATALEPGRLDGTRKSKRKRRPERPTGTSFTTDTGRYTNA
jgi:hypothetical protein